MTALMTPPQIADRPEPVRASDFERLGLAAQEARLDVIRVGVRRAAEPFVRRSLAGYSLQWESQLAQVLSSGYRAIDPRYRLRLNERASLSLWDPNPPVMLMAPWLLHPPPRAHHHIRERFDGYRTLPPVIIVKRAWNETPRLFGKRRWSVVAAGSVFAFACGLTLFLLSGAAPQEPLAAETPQTVRPEATPYPPATAVAATVLAETAPKAAALLANPAAKNPATASERADQASENPGILDAESQPFTLPELPEESSATPPLESSAATPERMELTEVPTTVAPPAEVLETFNVPAIPSPANPDLVLPNLATTGTTPPPKEAPEIENGPIPPSPEALEVARKRLRSLEAGQPANPAARLLLLQELQRNTEANTADRYVVMEAMIDNYVLEQRFDDALETLELLAEQFGTPKSIPAVEAAIRVCGRAETVTETERATNWSLRAAEMATRAELFDEANRAIKAANDIVSRTGSNSLRLRVKQVREGIAVIKRAQVADIDGIQPAEADEKTCSQAGRYLCLFIHDWDRGLPWLCRSSDAKLAKAAQADMDGEVSAAIDGYLDLLKSQRGRSSETLTLRAIELMKQHESKAVGLEAEQLKRRIKELTEQLPEDLRSVFTKKPIEQNPPPPVAVNAPTDGLLGRVRVSGRDGGALIRYQPGLEIGLNVLDQIFAALQLPKADTELDFVGFITIPAPTTVNIKSLGPQAPNGRIAVEVDGQAVDLKATGVGYTGRIDLPAGVHRIRWKVTAQVPSSCALTAEDDRDKTAIRFHHDGQIATALTTGLATQLRISVISN